MAKRIAFLLLLLIAGISRAQDVLQQEDPPVQTSPEKIVTPLRIVVPISEGGRMLPIGTWFRDAGFAPTQFGQRDISSFFPVSDGGRYTSFYEGIADTKKRYSNFGYVLYQRQLIEIKDTTAYLWITPLLDISYGAELQDTSSKKRYQNTRGARIEGTFGRKVFFTSSFYENQAILPGYVRDYVNERGEQYPDPTDSSYVTRNAVIPGAARTKPFKTNGFDYAYATGMVSYFATQRFTVHVGNQPVFVGSGYRSLLWSDNSVGMMNVRMRYRLNRKWDFQVVRARGLNLLRRPVATNGEAYYEPKSMSIATIHYSPVRSVSIGLFEGGMWYRGDSISQKSIPPLYFLPLPGAAALQQASDEASAYALTGIDFRAFIFDQLLYGQFALNPAKSKSSVYQLGIRIYPNGSPYFMIQAEYNHADENAYAASNPRLNYGNYNLPVAHPAGNHFDEFLLRVTYEYDHWFALLQTNYYMTQSVNPTLLMPVIKSNITSSKQVFNQYLEVGYRFNRTYGLETFAGFRYRTTDVYLHHIGTWVNLGIRTQLNNHYFDF